MTKVLILGAAGQVARSATQAFLESTDAELTLYLRRASRVGSVNPSRVRVIEGDVLEAADLQEAMQGQDVVFASLAGDLPRMAKGILEAMEATGVRRLIFISSMGIYDEVPSQRYRSILDPYRDAALAIEATDLDWTVLRPGWFTQEPEVNYQITRKGEPFRGREVSLASLSDLIVKLATTPGLHLRESLGISRG